MSRFRGLAVTAVMAGVLLLTGCSTVTSGHALAGASPTAVVADTAASVPAEPTPASVPTAPTATVPTVTVPTVTVPTSAGTPSGPPSTVPAPPPGDPFEGATEVDPQDFPGTVTPVGFSIAPGAIGCGFQPTATPSVVCQLDHHTYPDPPQDCHGGGAPGAAITLAIGSAAEFLCAGDLESGGPSLADGSMIDVDGLQCVSRQHGVACRDTSTGNGFRLTTASYDLTNGDTADGAASADTGTSSLSQFTGTWQRHGQFLTFTSAGRGTVTYRSYVWCESDPQPPCDATKGSEIIPGGKISFVLTEASGTTATGTVAASNDSAVPAGTAVTAMIGGHNLILSLWPDAPFCAPDTPDDEWNCGA